MDLPATAGEPVTEECLSLRVELQAECLASILVLATHSVV
ncbi:MAG: hypothetical protein ACI88C_002705, partial [Acidimicrobiales bacterium]